MWLYAFTYSGTGVNLEGQVGKKWQKYMAKGFALQDVQKYYKIMINVKAWYWSKREEIIKT